jgi:hypothetical protein
MIQKLPGVLPGGDVGSVVLTGDGVDISVIMVVVTGEIILLFRCRFRGT